MPTHDLCNRRVLITGGSSGVGEAVARLFAKAGAQVVITARRRDTLEAVAQSIGATALVADVSQADDCHRLIAEASAVLGGLDILINNAGCHHRGDFANQDADALAQMVDTNLRAPVMLSHLALPWLTQAPRGAIVNVGSVAGRMAVPGSATYSATKAGLRTLTYALAEELRGSSVSVSVVSPGPIATDFILSDIDAVTDLTFSQPMSTTDEIAQLVLDCVADGRTERTKPASTRVMTTLGYLFPSLPRTLRPLLAAKGRRAKKRYRRG